MSTKLLSLTVDGFRGAIQETHIDFRSSGDLKPRSLIISGDNGVGKSTFVDSLEYCLQGRIQRRQSLTDPDRPLVLALGKNTGTVRVELSDGRTVERSVYRDKDGKLHRSNSSLDSGFSIAPFILRRSDILQFWETPVHRRQTVFVDYNLAGEGGVLDELDQAKVARLERSRAEVKSSRREVQAQLARHLGLKQEEVPLTGQELDDFARDRVYGGLTRKQRNVLEYKGRIVRIDRTASRMLKTMKQLTREIISIQEEIKEINQKTRITSGDRMSAISQLFSDASDNLTRAFRQVSTIGHRVASISVKSGGHTNVSLEIDVNLKSGHTVDPRRFFSEANLDLLALLLFLSISKAASDLGQSKILVLDDVLQSVDAGIRVRVAEYILDEFKTWQLIFTVHDRMWKEQLVSMFRRSSHDLSMVDIKRYDENIGPVIIGSNDGLASLLEASIERGDSISICAHAGLLLEQVCQNLSWRLPISVTRRQEDKYTLGDLWPGLLKVLKRTSVVEQAVEVDRWIHLRNLAGAHFNEWAQSVSRYEATEIGSSSLNLYSATHCSVCHRWIEQNGNEWSCRCGKNVVTKV